jgi:hypothetical protein
MVAVPGNTPVIIPVDPPIVTVPVILLQVPPGDVSLKLVVKPTHVFRFPVIAPGKALTVTVASAAQPVGNEYEIVAVPADMPVTTPVVPVVAIVVALLLHTPPPEGSLKVVVNPGQTVMTPFIGNGPRLTVTDIVVKQPGPDV